MQLGQFGRAEKCLLDILKVAPNLIEAHNSLGFVYAAGKQHQKALEQFERVLAANPKHAHTHHNIANSLYGLGLYEKAIEHFQAALSIDGKLTDSLIHCGMAYHQLGQTEAAIQCLHRALDQDKLNAYAFHVLGKFHADLKDYPRALDYLQNASNLAPENIEFQLEFARTLDKSGLIDDADSLYLQICKDNPDSLDTIINYTKFLITYRRYDEALGYAQHAQQIAPKDAQVTEQLARIHLSMNNTEEALKHFNNALIQSPNNLSILRGLGIAYLETGDFAKASAIAEEMIATDNEAPDGYLLKSHLKKSSIGDNLTKHLLRLSISEKISEEDKMLVHYALGKLLDDQKNYSDAFAHFKIANEIQEQSYLNKQHFFDENSLSQLISLFTSDFIDSHKHLGTENDTPIFIVGMPRSGTTLTEQIISSHPNVLAAGEFNFWDSVNKSLPLRMQTKNPYPECLHEMTNRHAKEIIKQYENALRKIVGPNTSSTHITDKLPHNFLHLGLISILFPNVKIIHTKRDPIDTCLSIYFQHFNKTHEYATSLSNLVAHYKRYERLMQHWHTVLPGRILDINYEDTISDPEYWSRQLISHIGLEWDDACLAPHKLERAVKTFSQWQVRQPIYKTSVQRWKNYEPFITPLIEGLAKDYKAT